MTKEEKQTLLATAQGERERWKHQQGIPIVIRKESLFCLIATIQLACRHPHFNGPTRVVVAEIAEHLTELFAEDPATTAIIALGWDQTHDC